MLCWDLFARQNDGHRDRSNQAYQRHGRRPTNATFRRVSRAGPPFVRIQVDIHCFIYNYSREDLQDLLTDRNYFQALFHSLPRVKAMYAAQAELGLANETIASEQLGFSKQKSQQTSQ